MKDAANDGDAKKKYKTAAIWTNYSAFIKILQMLFSKLTEHKRLISKLSRFFNFFYLYFPFE